MRPGGILVVGMGRSGTSAITRAINLLGVPLLMAESLIEADARNPRGYWEARPVVMLNTELLADLGGDAITPPSLPSEWERAPRLEGLRARGQALLEGAPHQWVTKDPRLSHLIPFWKLLSPNLVVVIAVRHPTAVASSLGLDGVGPQTAAALWELTTRRCIEASRGGPTAFVHYDRLIAEPVRTLEEVTTFLTDLGFDVGDVGSAAASVSPAGRTFDVDPNVVALTDEQESLYAQLLALPSAHKSLNIELTDPSLTMKALIEEYRTPRRSLVAAWSQSLATGARLADAVSAVDQLTVELFEKGVEVEAARSELAGLKRLIATLAPAASRRRRLGSAVIRTALRSRPPGPPL